MFEIRTDLAVETSEKRPDGKEISGLFVEKEKRGEDITITKVRIETQKAAKTMGKPRGTYISIEADQMMEEDNDYHREISEIFSDERHLGISSCVAKTAFATGDISRIQAL